MRTPSILFAAGLVLSASFAGAASPRDTLVVSTSWLAQHLKDPDLVLLHVGDKVEYDVAHIPGARFVGLRDISSTGPDLTLELPPAQELREKLMALGISDSSRIVVYYGKDWVSPSTRVVFTLDYAGLGDRTSLLDGGQGAWVREGQPTTAAVPEVKPGALSPLKVRPLVVTADFVRDHATTGRNVLIDARDRRFYDGVQAGGPKDAPKLGHIPGAVSVPFSETTDDKLLLRPADELQALFAKAGVKPGDTLITYCHIGQQATATLFAARTLGYNVLLYDGSFEDWAKRGYPLDNPAAAKSPAGPKEPR